jgi:hypothetical protein
VPLSSPAGPLEDLLIPFAPQRTLETIAETVELYTAADPKVAAALTLVRQRLGSLPPEDLDALAAVFWATYRRGLRPGAPAAPVRAWLDDGDRLLRAAHIALDTFMRASAVAAFADAVRRVESTDSAETRELQRARAELAPLVATDVGPPKVLGFVAVFGSMHVAHYLDTHGGYEDED